MKKLMCPQCGSPLLYVESADGKLYFNVDTELHIVPTKPEYEAVAGMALEEISCANCSWHGPVRRLKRVFAG